MIFSLQAGIVACILRSALDSRVDIQRRCRLFRFVNVYTDHLDLFLPDNLTAHGNHGSVHLSSKGTHLTAARPPWPAASDRSFVAVLARPPTPATELLSAKCQQYTYPSSDIGVDYAPYVASSNLQLYPVGHSLLLGKASIANNITL